MLCNRSIWRPMILLTVVVIVVAFFYTRVSAPHWELPIGQSLPNFTLANVMHPNTVLTEKDLLGKPVVLHVWASWCTNYAAEVPVLQQIRQQDQAVWLGVNFKDNLRNAQQWLETHGDSLGTHLYDPNGVLSYVLGVIGTPETFILDCQGKVVYRHAGVLSVRLYQDTMQPILRGLASCVSS